MNPRLKLQIHEYLEYKWNEEKTNKHKEELNVLNKLSTNLKNELLLEANISILN